ncbi:ATP-binding cassette domain-containing protein [Nonomuraea sp. NPDC049400]|uniref:ATP-binding cassette domain-containing protein n=1 Tax=Nonomuraea sp. NPDC049400 TaxID=3364352 RepID=UPI0037A5B622
MIHGSHRRHRPHQEVREPHGPERHLVLLEEGEIFGLLGPNGTGKTTTVECVEGLRRPDGGSIRVLGLDSIRDGRELRERIGVQLQSTQLPENIKVWEALSLAKSYLAGTACCSRDRVSNVVRWAKGVPISPRRRWPSPSGGRSLIGRGCPTSTSTTRPPG